MFYKSSLTCQRIFDIIITSKIERGHFMTGTEVKSMIKGAGLKCWEVAYAMNMQDSNFSRRLRKPFNENEVNNIKEIINKLSAEKEA